MAVSVGFVVIGRNEGARLQRSLRSAVREGGRVVYVDSGSTDGSTELARAEGAVVVPLDMQRSFTAARARNAGLVVLLASDAPPEFVHFIDGDCELASGWVQAAVALMQCDPQIAVVCGRRRERHPATSIYNQLCDIEWNTPIGPSRSCGGDALMRVSAFTEVRGFREDLIAGEEPELCVRLRAAGWRVYRHDADMTWHDAAMSRFSQWWQRSKRAGHAFAAGNALHGSPPEAHCRREMLRPWLWVVGVPLLIISGVVAQGPAALLGLLVYPAQVARQALGTAPDSALRWLRPALLLLGKVAELQGQLSYWRTRLAGRPAQLIEYKG